VNLGKPTNAALADGQGLGTIINDDGGATGTPVYMPLLIKGGAPNLIGSFSLSPARASYVAGEPVIVTAVITNVGTAPAGPFWADFYINPAERPSVNRKWYDICSTNPCLGIAWAIRQSLAPGESVTVTSTVESYSPGHTIWHGWLPAGTTDLYLLVDSWNAGNPLAAVAESNENDNLSELHGLTVSGPTPRLPDGATRLPAAPRRLER
ncbi:MAG TPA: CARDB domain-containing protein, partial [Herpetosiphonaceae bacterium]|nr:CARDB domain-containing protein [Herpetosiphonaceae bacterium]